jgi:hypothetical protein
VLQRLKRWLSRGGGKQRSSVTIVNGISRTREGPDPTPSGMQGALQTMLFEPRHYNLSIVMVRPIPVRDFNRARQRQRKGWRIARPRSAQSMSNLVRSRSPSQSVD